MKFTLNELNLIRQAVELWDVKTIGYRDECKPEGSQYAAWERQHAQLKNLLNKITTTEL